MTETLVTAPSRAHAVRPAILAPSDPVFAEIIAALSATPLLGFDMGATVIVGDAGVEGRVWVRANGQTWTLTSLDASLIALMLRLEPFRAAGMFADAFVQASLQAERRVAAVHEWSGRIRPTEDGE